MPSASAFAEAVQFPETAFTDPVLASAQPELSPLGLPRGVSGAFAIVFRMRTGDQSWAAKCFFNPSDDLERRFAALSERLSAHPVEAVPPFAFLPAGIRVEGRTWPVLRMPWLEARPLVAHVQHHLDDAGALLALAAALAATQRELEAAQIAHGDLQHGNVLVAGAAQAPRPLLIDLDAAYVPALRRLGSAEAGHRNYAHPDRTSDDFGPHLDRFSFVVLEASLRALAARPALWDAYHTGENLIFSAADFFDPDASALLADLGGDARTAGIAETVRRASLLPPDRIPPLGEAVGTPRRSARRSDPTERTASAAAGWIAVGASLAAAAAFGVALGSPAAALVVGLLAAAAGASFLALAYRRHPHTRRTQRLRQEGRRLDEQVDALEAERTQILTDRERLTSGIDAIRDERLRQKQDDALRDRLKYHLIAEVGAVPGVTHKAVVRLKLAGIRNAWHATPERVRSAMELGDETRARIGLWRSGLVETYRSEVPGALTEGEERRLARERRYRLDELADALHRLDERRATLDAERSDLAARLAAHEPLGLPAFARRRLTGRPLPTVAPPAPAAPARRAQPVVTSDDGPWWQR